MTFDFLLCGETAVCVVVRPRRCLLSCQVVVHAGCHSCYDDHSAGVRIRCILGAPYPWCGTSMQYRAIAVVYNIQEDLTVVGDLARSISSELI
jgi:hypothetical protein